MTTTTESQREFVRQVQDLEELLAGGASFFAEGQMPGGFDSEAFIKSWAHLIDTEIGCVFGLYGEDGVIHGALGGILAPDIFNGHTVAIEAFWYVLPEHRGSGAIRLVKAYEDWARSRGARRVSMVHLLNLQPGRLGDLYVRLGYRAVETNYIKDL